MSTTLTVPAQLVQSLREGVRLEIFGSASEEITELTYSERPAEDYRQPLARFNAAYELLNRIGWVKPGVQRDVQIDIDEYGALVLEALQAQLVTEREQAECARGRSGRDAASALVGALDELIGVLAAKLGQPSAGAGGENHSASASRIEIEPLD
jgi:hypothetical protein